MCRVTLQVFFWGCGCLQPINDTTCARQCQEPRFEHRFEPGECLSCLMGNEEIQKKTWYYRYTLLLCNNQGLSKTVETEWNPRTLNKNATPRDFLITYVDSRMEEAQDRIELSLGEKREFWFVGYKKWQEIVWGKLVRKYGEVNLREGGYPRILSWGEFRHDVVMNGAREALKWDYQMAECG